MAVKIRCNENFRTPLEGVKPTHPEVLEAARKVIRERPDMIASLRDM